jgi:hypothetical protein
MEKNDEEWASAYRSTKVSSWDGFMFCGQCCIRWGSKEKEEMAKLKE